jgi:hypothetical protein
MLTVKLTLKHSMAWLMLPVEVDEVRSATWPMLPVEVEEVRSTTWPMLPVEVEEVRSTTWPMLPMEVEVEMKLCMILLAPHKMSPSSWKVGLPLTMHSVIPPMHPLLFKLGLSVVRWVVLTMHSVIPPIDPLPLNTANHELCHHADDVTLQASLSA